MEIFKPERNQLDLKFFNQLFVSNIIDKNALKLKEIIAFLCLNYKIHFSAVVNVIYTFQSTTVFHNQLKQLGTQSTESSQYVLLEKQPLQKLCEYKLN